MTNHFPVLNRVCLLTAPKQVTHIKTHAAYLTEKRVKLAQKLDEIVMRFAKKHLIDAKVWQFPVVLVPLTINTDTRDAVVLRPICSDEAMTAHFYKMTPNLLKKLTALLRPHVSAVLYDITNKPPGTIEWE